MGDKNRIEEVIDKKRKMLKMSINKGLFTSNSDEYSTPMDLFDTLNNEFNFTLDPCSTNENAKCDKHYTKTENGLIQDWNNEVVFCNPPYGRQIGLWVKKCYEHFVSGGGSCNAHPSSN